MKNRKLPLFGKLALLFFGVVVFCSVFASFADYALNGLFRQFFADRYLIEYPSYDAVRQVDTLVTTVNWSALKLDGIVFLGIFAVLLALAWIFSARREGRRREQETAAEIHDKIRAYFKGSADAEDVFQGKYGELQAQMVQLKASMEKKETALKTEAQRKNDLITYLAHDLRTPLTSVLGYLNLLSEAPDMPKELREKYTRIALGKAERLEGLMNEFFEITQYNLQTVLLEKEKIDLHYMLLQMTEEFYPILAEKGNLCQVSCEEDLRVYGDPERLARVFNNLLKNAVSYSYPHTPIQIEAHRKKQGGEDWVEIRFSNQGRTIPKEKLDLIFEKFFRADEARKSNTGGAGLGLAIAKELAELHGGQIFAESKEQVTVFTVLLPEGGNTPK